jgi:hypothetical protein
VSTEQHKKHVDQLFLKFAVFYGHVWRSQFKNDDFLKFAKKEWLLALKQFSKQLIEKITYYCRDNSEFPPSLPKFIVLCRQEQKRNNFFKFEDDFEKGSLEVNKKFMASIKKLIN